MINVYIYHMIEVIGIAIPLQGATNPWMRVLTFQTSVTIPFYLCMVVWAKSHKKVFPQWLWTDSFNPCMVQTYKEHTAVPLLVLLPKIYVLEMYSLSIILKNLEKNQKYGVEVLVSSFISISFNTAIKWKQFHADNPKAMGH